MNDSADRGGIPSKERRGLEELGGAFLANERDIRVAVMNAIDAGHDLRAVAEAAQLPLSLVEEWTGETRRPTDVAPADDAPAALDQVGEQRRLRSGTLRQRVDAADAKSARADAAADREASRRSGSPEE